MKILNQQILLETDQYGYFSHRIKLKPDQLQDIFFTLFAKTSGNTTLFLGKFKPSFLDEEKKIIISDFDKTLVETKYRTLKELYQSLTFPISNFPTLKKNKQSF